MAQSQSFIGQLCPSRFSPFVELDQSIPSQVEAISPFLDQLMRFIRRFRTEDGSEVDIEIAVREALTNAIVHGNHENAEKRVYVASRCSQDGEVLVTIRDLGQGFDSRLVPDPTAAENRLSAHGRGIYLMQALMDEVQFEDGGTVVKLRKQSNASHSSPEQKDSGVSKMKTKSLVILTALMLVVPITHPRSPDRATVTRNISSSLAVEPAVATFGSLSSARIPRTANSFTYRPRSLACVLPLSVL